MAEDVSAQARLSVGVMSASSLLMIVLNLMVVMMSYLNNFEYGIITAIQSVKLSGIKAIEDERRVTSAEAYKAIIASDISVDKIYIIRNGTTIKTLTENGTVDNNFEYLLRNASQMYKVTSQDVDGIYSFNLVEVN